jgi:hypothetical protein
MSVEDHGTVHSPTVADIWKAVDALHPGTGPSFIILEGESGDYAQAAGGAGAFTVEWREYLRNRFCHYVAGRSRVVDEGEVTIRIFDSHVKVRSNERLSTDEVKQILTAFAEGLARPLSFKWRDVSDQFE